MPTVNVSPAIASALGASVIPVDARRKPPANPLSGTVQEAFASDKTNWEYVNIPEEDALGNPHPGITLNFQKFGPGSHLLPPIVAAHVKERLKVVESESRRILLPRQDKKTISAMAKSGVAITQSPDENRGGAVA